MPRVFWAAGLAVHTADREYKPTPTQSWANVSSPSATLAHIQRGAKHNMLTQYWANVGSSL